MTSMGTKVAPLCDGLVESALIRKEGSRHPAGSEATGGRERGDSELP